MTGGRTFFRQGPGYVGGAGNERDVGGRDVRIVRELRMEHLRARCTSQSPELHVDVRALRMHYVCDLSS